MQQTRQEEYYFVINLLKAAQDEQTKGFVTGPGNPWGPSYGDSECSGYHLVWMLVSASWGYIADIPSIVQTRYAG